MVMNFNNNFSEKRTFRDITKERLNVVKLMCENAPSNTVMKIYECRDSIIIHSKTDITNHASISNIKGYRYIEEWEITYVLDHILKLENKDVIMQVSTNNVIHFYPKDEATLLN